MEKKSCKWPSFFQHEKIKRKSCFNNQIHPMAKEYLSFCKHKKRKKECLSISNSSVQDEWKKFNYAAVNNIHILIDYLKINTPHLRLISCQTLNKWSFDVWITFCPSYWIDRVCVFEEMFYNTLNIYSQSVSICCRLLESN